MTSFVGRCRAVLTLDTEIYGEIARDPHATAQALVVVVVSSLPSTLVGGPMAGVAVALFTVVAWVVAGVVLLFVNRVVPQPASSMTELIAGAPERQEATPVGFVEVLRATGFAYAPRFFADLLLIPVSLLGAGGLFLGPFVRLAALLWVAAAYVASISNVFETTILRSFVLIFLTWLLFLGAAVGIAVLYGPVAPS